MYTSLIVKSVLSVIFTQITKVIWNRYFEAKAKVITYIVQASSIPVTIPNNTTPVVVNSHTIVVKNIGKKTAKDIRIGHHHLPSYQVHSNASHQISTNPANTNAVELIFPTLVAGEQITISYLYFPPLVFSNINAYSKYDEGNIDVVDIILTPQPNKNIVKLLNTLILLGVFTTFYIVCSLMYWGYIYFLGNT